MKPAWTELATEAAMLPERTAGWSVCLKSSTVRQRGQGADLQGSQALKETEGQLDLYSH
jgi:hypothetical protein